jgi:hypothetical protein
VGAALGVGARLLQPAGGRIVGRAARDRAPATLTGAFTLQALTVAEPAAVPETVGVAAPRRPASRRPARGKSAPAAASPATARRPLSPVQAALLAAKGQN